MSCQSAIGHAQQQLSLSESDAQDFIDVKHYNAFRVTSIAHFVSARDL
jgi:hypothetical protein